MKVAAATRAEVLECRIRTAMATLTPARGFDSARVRQAELDAIDVMLDAYSLELALTSR